MITSQGSTVQETLLCDHEEAGTKLIAYTSVASEFANGIMVRSPSGDIDVVALFVCNRFRCNVYLDNDAGKDRKILDVNSNSTLSDKQKEALIGLHSFSGNDYVSSFFRKGKTTCWKTLLKNEIFSNVFSELGTSFVINEQMLNNIQNFVCVLYGQSKLREVNEARNAVFGKYEGLGKIVDMCMLPPCFGNLQLHTRRANYVASIYRQSRQLIMSIEHYMHHGWTEDGAIVWMDEVVPNDMESILISDNDRENELEIGNEGYRSDDDDDVNIEEFD